VSTQDQYRPWRTAPAEDQPALDTAAAAQWQSMLDETRRGVSELTSLLHQMDSRLTDGARMLGQVEQSVATAHAAPTPEVLRIEQQLRRIELRLDRVEAATEQRAASAAHQPQSHQPLDHLLSQLHAEAA